MAEVKNMRLNKVLREFNISLDRAVEYLNSKGIEIEARPTTKIDGSVYQALADEFQTDKSKKVASKEVGAERRKEQEELRLQREKELEEKQKRQEVIKAKASLEGPKQVGKVDLNAGAKSDEASKPTEKVQEPKKEVEKEPEAKAPSKKTEEESKEVEQVSNRPKATGTTVKGKIDLSPKKKSKSKSKPEAKKEAPNAPEKKPEVAKESPKVEDKPVETAKATEEQDKEVKETATGADGQESEVIKTEYKKLGGLKVTGKKIDLSQFAKPKKKTADSNRGKRKRISKPGASGPGGNNRNSGNNKNRRGSANTGRKNIVKEEPTDEEIQKQVRETLEKLQGKSSNKGAKNRRQKRDRHREKVDAAEQAEAEDKSLQVTEFVTVSDLSTMMDVPVNKVIGACMSLGMMVTMNQRLDAETMSIVADEFGYEVEFVNADIEESIAEVEDKEEDLVTRAPIVTVMGHVDHGKTSLLDYIRKENVIAGESGGITQHIGAYGVQLDNGQKIAFLDTPGHEAFTAMRARGAQVTDIAIIVAAADDDIMPQTKEAISHAQAAGVPIVFAINKIDKPDANPERVKEGLAQMNLLVEDWGGKIQSHDISAKVGTGVKELLEKVLLEAELLDLKANPNKPATGTVVEAFLDKGRGYVSTILVQAGTLKVGDYVLAGPRHGKIKAMQDERGKDVLEAGPATPVSILGLDGAPQAGDKFNVFEDEREAKSIAARRTQLQREQSVRTQKTLSLEDIGRRIALGNFQELNLILKGDVDGSVEALTDSFQKLSTEEIQVNIIHKGVGAITESDVLLATASDAIIIGFNVRPQGNARTVADREEVDIRTYSIIYDAINDLKDAMEGMLSPEFKEEITGNAEVRQTFKISKVGTIAGCMVTDGKVYRNGGIRLIRDGIVIHTGELVALKRFKDDVKEVSKGYECGMQVKNFNDLIEGDILESFREVEVKKTLK
ncbi:translation initiation factor IF-2 [Nonlabens dokdonensis]|uniref:Translation initiation factor IF-2 n=2 Tax=Nonlabens dokdonensis TaxID=328515 RepID=L7WDC4_NONDD|nr:translation initiation factor IF-2 [Nonlabens dokdonensis]AGC76878.1 translation initiation factor IF-2 [Nonlabens dokdonensis DSW-6]PZX36787.1 translation initiation factor IF-2 [Nonlabens dokdonensis]